MDTEFRTNGDAPYTKVRITVKKNVKYAEYYAPTVTDMGNLFIPVEELKNRRSALLGTGESAPLTTRAISLLAQRRSDEHNN